VPLCLQTPQNFNPDVHIGTSIPLPSSYVAVCYAKVVIANSVRAIRLTLRGGSSEFVVAGMQNLGEDCSSGLLARFTFPPWHRLPEGWGTRLVEMFFSQGHAFGNRDGIYS